MKKLYWILILFLLISCETGGIDNIPTGSEIKLTEIREVTIISHELIYDPGAYNCFYGWATIKNTGNIDLPDLSYKYWGGDILEGIGEMIPLDAGEILVIDTRNKVLFVGGYMPPGDYAGFLRIYNHQTSPKVQMTFDIARLIVS